MSRPDKGPRGTRVRAASRGRGILVINLLRFFPSIATEEGGGGRFGEMREK